MTEEQTPDAPTTPDDVSRETLPEPDKDVRPSPPKKRATTRAGRKAETAQKRAARARAAAQAGDKPDKRPTGQRGPRVSPLATRLDAAILGVGSAVTIGGAVIGSEPLIADGAVINANSKPLSDALDKLAKNDPRVAAALERMLTAGAYGGLIAAVLPIAIGIMGNHNMIPANVAGMVGGDVPQPAATGLPDEAFATPAA